MADNNDKLKILNSIEACETRKYSIFKYLKKNRDQFILLKELIDKKRRKNVFSIIIETMALIGFFASAVLAIYGVSMWAVIPLLVTMLGAYIGSTYIRFTNKDSIKKDTQKMQEHNNNIEKAKKALKEIDNQISIDKNKLIEITKKEKQKEEDTVIILKEKSKTKDDDELER